VNHEPPRRAKGRRTRARLMDSAERVFIEKGYLAARVADISDAAGLAHGSFYTYFDSKEDVFRELVEVALQEVSEAIDVHDDSALPADRIRIGNRRYIDVYARHAALLGLIEQVGTLTQFHAMRRDLRARFVSRIEAVIKEDRRAGLITVEPLDSRAVAHALVGMMDSFAYNWFVLNENFDREVALANIDAIWLRTLGLKATAPPGSSAKPRAIPSARSPAKKPKPARRAAAKRSEP
jgi:AcrR family transcriptional regulator